MFEIVVQVVYQRQQGYNKDCEWMDVSELRKVIERPKTGIVNNWRGRGSSERVE